MRTKQALTVAMMCGLALSFNASAKVVWDNEVTNNAFTVTATSPGESDLKWTKPTDGTVDFSGGVIALDTDLTDPLIYSNATMEATGAAIVSAHFAATANADTPALEGEAPQAALTVIASGADTNWYGLVDVSGEAMWEKFTNVIPTVGDAYDIKIEFDLRSGSKKIRYSVSENNEPYVVLTGASAGEGNWYGNPQSGATTIQSVSFAGTGDITSFAGDTVAEMLPIATIGATTQTNKVDYTNGTLNVSITAAAAGTATLKVIDFATGAVKTYADIDVTTATPSLGWNLADEISAGLVPGGTYGYELTIAPTGERKNLDVTVTGTFVAAGETPVGWFHADATGALEDVDGGEWADTSDFPKPSIVDNAYVIEEAAKFNVTDSNKGTNNLTRVDANVTFESFVDGDSLEVELDALGGFVAATKDNENVWMALTTINNVTNWFALAGALAPEKDEAYVVRAEVSFLTGNKKVRYLVKKEADTDFVTLDLNGNQWLNLADDAKDTLAAVELKGSGKLAKLEANIADRALAEVNGKKCYTIADLVAASEAGNFAITLLTDISAFKPTEAGTYTFLGGYRPLSVDVSGLTGGNYVWNGNQLVVTAGPGTIFKFY